MAKKRKKKCIGIQFLPREFYCYFFLTCSKLATIQEAAIQGEAIQGAAIQEEAIQGAAIQEAAI